MNLASHIESVTKFGPRIEYGALGRRVPGRSAGASALAVSLAGQVGPSERAESEGGRWVAPLFLGIPRDDRSADADKQVRNLGQIEHSRPIRALPTVA